MVADYHFNHMPSRKVTDSPTSTPRIRDKVQLVATSDGLSLFMRRFTTTRRPAMRVFVGHGPIVHSGLLTGFCEQLANAGMEVFSGDLRAHGRSVSRSVPLGHLDPENGWSLMIDDFEAMLRVAFANTPREERVIIGGGFSGHLALEVLRRDPRIARHVILVAPTPDQPRVWALARAFLTLRRFSHGLNRPDPQFQHVLNSFLSAHLPRGSGPHDWLSADPAAVRRVEDDPLGMPVATVGYWLAVINGMSSAWSWPIEATLPEDLRLMVLTGPDDPQMRGGRLMPAIRAWCARRGMQDPDLVLVDGVRANVMIDAPNLPVVPAVLGWLTEAGALPQPPVPDEMPYEDPVAAFAPVIEVLGLAGLEDDLPVSDLIELCYDAIEDDGKWRELVYRIVLSSATRDPDATDADGVLRHMERALTMRNTLRRTAILGMVYRELADRLDIGLGVLDETGKLQHWNRPFETAIAEILGEEQSLDPIGIQQAIARLTGSCGDADNRADFGGGPDIPLLHEGVCVGLVFRPRAVEPGRLADALVDRVIALRTRGSAQADRQHRASLISQAYGLTLQEAVVTLLICEGLTIEDIAATLSIRDSTVRSHTKSIFAKLGVSSRPALTHSILAGPLGWLCAPSSSGKTGSSEHIR